MSAKHVVVHGRVQGVLFRATAIDTASDLGVAGWVRNRHDGTVEMVLEGDETSVDLMIAWARRGPEHARVDEVEVGDRRVEGLRGFTEA